jgi:nucleoside-diphosphate-sugar epimerase
MSSDPARIPPDPTPPSSPMDQRLLRNQPVHIHGDGQTTRDFCYVANAVQANLLAATTARHGALNQIYNVALHQRTSLIELFELIRRLLATHHPQIAQTKPVYSPFRKGDIRHSEADISKARRFLGYQPTHPSSTVSQKPSAGTSLIQPQSDTPPPRAELASMHALSQRSPP